MKNKKNQNQKKKEQETTSFVAGERKAFKPATPTQRAVPVGKTRTWKSEERRVVKANRTLDSCPSSLSPSRTRFVISPGFLSYARTRAASEVYSRRLGRPLRKYSRSLNDDLTS